MTIQECPLKEDWDKWDMFNPKTRFNVLKTQEEIDIHTRARAAKRGELLETIPLSWEVAADDLSLLPENASEPPIHRHTEVEIAGERVHLDYIRRTKSGPGRTFNEIRIFINGQFAGRGGGGSTSLGGGGSDMPAVALIGEDKLLTTGGEEIKLWSRL